jgi:glycosyltransferase involved in cell wall biosynthesis
MNILIWCPFISPGGGKRLLVQLVAAIARQEGVASVRLVVPPDAISPLALNPDGALPIEIITHAPTPLQRWLRADIPAMNRSALQSLRAYLRRTLLPAHEQRVNQRHLQTDSVGCDVIYVFWPQQQPVIDTRLPVVCTIQDTTYLDFPEILGGKLSLAEKRNTEIWLRRAAAVVVSSSSTRANLERHFGSAGTRVHIIYHNILPQANNNPLPARPARLTAPYIVYAANINTHKNHEMLLLAWARFKYRQQYALVLVGDGTHVLDASWSLDRNIHWQQDRLVSLADRLGLRGAGEIMALGYVPDHELEAVMRHASAVVMPSLAEGGGSYPVEEALTFGVPVVCADIPVMREHLAARSAEVVWFDPLSPEAIARALETLVDRYAHLLQSAQAGMADPRPTWDEVAAEYVRVFASAAARRARIAQTDAST